MNLLDEKSGNGRVLKLFLLWVLLFSLIVAFTVSGVRHLWNASSHKAYNKGLDAMTVGESLEGFELKRKVYSEDFEGEVYLFEHLKNGGKVVYVASNDDNKWFDITFRTPAVDDTGVNHIIEHTVLEGSKRFNLKSPFTEMSKRSVNTFMNAFTGADNTSYPVASENSKDFENLTSIYLDAVFSPLVTENSKLLMQEGWRYEVNPTNGTIDFNGVVFNEMKGALSGKYDAVYTAIPSTLYPDTKYRFNSGGSPESIVDLTHDHLVDIYKRHYTPSNACVTFYGNLELKDQLKQLNDLYYSQYGRSTPIVDDKVQTPFLSTRHAYSTYPADETANSEQDSLISFNMAISDIDESDKIGLELLTQLISEGYDSELFERTVNAGIGQSISGYFDTSYYQPMLNLLLEGANVSDEAAFEEAVHSSFDKIAKNGFPKEKIESALNRYEFGFKNSLNSANRGENAIYAIQGSFILNEDPLEKINQELILDEIRGKILEGGYFEGLLNRHVLNNKHVSVVTFIPDTYSMTALDDRLASKLSERTSQLSDEALQVLKKESQAYASWQRLPVDQGSLKSLPNLELTDLDLSEVESTLKKHTVGDMQVLKHQVYSNGITQGTLYFDLKALTLEELEYLPLYQSVLIASDTETMDNFTLMNKLESQSDGLHIETLILQDSADPLKIYPFMKMSTRFLDGKGDLVFPMIQDILLNAQFDQPDMVEQELGLHLDQLESEMSGEGSQVAYSRLQSALTASGQIKDVAYTKGYDTLRTTETQLDTAYPALVNTLEGIHRKLVCQKGVVFSIASSQEGLKSAEVSYEELLKSLPLGEIKKNEDSKPWVSELHPVKSGIVMPSEMQNISMGFNLNATGSGVDGQDLIFSQILSEGYMYEKIRLHGGAYGGYCYIDQDSNFIFETYRDPNLKESVDTIYGVEDYLKSFSVDQQTIDHAIVSVVGRMYQRQGTFEEVDAQDESFFMPYDSVAAEAFYNEIMDVKPSQLDAFRLKIAEGLKTINLVVAGSENQILNNRELFEVVE